MSELFLFVCFFRVTPDKGSLFFYSLQAVQEMSLLAADRAVAKWARKLEGHLEKLEVDSVSMGFSDECVLNCILFSAENYHSLCRDKSGTRSGFRSYHSFIRNAV